MATQAAHPKPDKKLPPLTPEELKKQEGEKPVEGAAIDDFTSRFIRPDGGKPPAAAPPEKKLEKKPLAAKPKPKVTPPATAPQLSAEEITEAAARGVASALKKPEEPPAKVEDATAKLPADEQRRIAVLTEMEKANPGKYKDISKLYQESLAKLVTYADDWEKVHPGETFDEEAPEHKDFIEQNEAGLDWDDDDYTDALAEIKVQKVVGESRKQTEAQQEHTKRLQAALPEIAKTRLSAGKSFLEKVGPEFAAIVGADGVVVKENFDKLNAEDPVKAEIVISSADLVEKLVAENYALFKQLVPFSKEGTKVIGNASCAAK